MLEASAPPNPDSLVRQRVESARKKIMSFLSNKQLDLLRHILDRFNTFSNNNQNPSYRVTLHTDLNSRKDTVSISGSDSSTNIPQDGDVPSDWPEPPLDAPPKSLAEIEAENKARISALEQPEPVFVPDFEKMNRPLSFEPVKQRSGPLLFTLSDEAREAIDQHTIQLVYQKGIGFVDGSQREQRFLETSDFDGAGGFGSCVVFIAHDPETKKTALAHCDMSTDVAGMIELVKQKIGPTHLEFSVLGGQDDKSESLVKEISQELAQFPQSTIKHLDVLGPTSLSRQAIFDAATGSLFDLMSDGMINAKPWSGPNEQPQSVKDRATQVNVAHIPFIVDVDKLPSLQSVV